MYRQLQTTHYVEGIYCHSPDFRPIALTSLVMKSFERILKDEITSMVQGKLDPLQFAYQEGKGADDAKLYILERVYKHLEKPKSFAKILFADFSI